MAGRLRHLPLVAVTLALVLTACVPPPPPPPSTVIVYGDSLVVEAREAIERRIGAAFPGRAVQIRAVGGTAQCDFHQQMNADAPLQPEAVVIAFYGNRLIPCWSDESPGRGCADSTIQIRHTDGAERYAETITQALRSVIS